MFGDITFQALIVLTTLEMTFFANGQELRRMGYNLLLVDKKLCNSVVHIASQLAIKCSVSLNHKVYMIKLLR